MLFVHFSVRGFFKMSFAQKWPFIILISNCLIDGNDQIRLRNIHSIDMNMNEYRIPTMKNVQLLQTTIQITDV